MSNVNSLSDISKYFIRLINSWFRISFLLTAGLSLMKKGEGSLFSEEF